MNILLDMNLSFRWKAFLEGNGHHCIHWSEIDDPGAPDPIILDWARGEAYVLFTHDLDFGAILAATGANAPSVIQIRTQDIFPEANLGLIERVLASYEPHLQSGALIVIDKSRSRIRLLPLSETPGRKE